MALVSSWPGSRTLIIRRGYVLSHNNVDKIADWVAYHLTRECADGQEIRPGSSAFKPDPLLQQGTRAELADYRGSGYDRGHQCPAGDSKGRGDTVMRESFFLSNMTPQEPQLNQRAWRDLESNVRDWVRQRRELWIVTGPAWVDEDNDGLVSYYVIGPNEVAVPTHYFKIVLATDGQNDPDVLAFLLPNARLPESIERYLVSVDEVEATTGLDFFPSLDESVELQLESTTPTTLWNQN